MSILQTIPSVATSATKPSPISYNGSPNPYSAAIAAVHRRLKLLCQNAYSSFLFQRRPSQIEILSPLALPAVITNAEHFRRCSAEEMVELARGLVAGWRCALPGMLYDSAQKGNVVALCNAMAGITHLVRTHRHFQSPGLSEDLGQALNQLIPRVQHSSMHAKSAWLRAYIMRTELNTSQEPKAVRRFANDTFERLIKSQHADGWFDGGGGLNVSLSVSIWNALAEWHRATNDDRAANSINKCLGFIIEITNSDCSIGGAYSGGGACPPPFALIEQWAKANNDANRIRSMILSKLTAESMTHLDDVALLDRADDLQRASDSRSSDLLPGPDQCRTSHAAAALQSLWIRRMGPFQIIAHRVSGAVRINHSDRGVLLDDGGPLLLDAGRVWAPRLNAACKNHRNQESQLHITNTWVNAGTESELPNSGSVWLRSFLRLPGKLISWCEGRRGHKWGNLASEYERIISIKENCMLIEDRVQSSDSFDAMALQWPSDLSGDMPQRNALGEAQSGPLIVPGGNRARIVRRIDAEGVELISQEIV